MPECKECIASGQQAKRCFHAAHDAGHDFTLQGLALDATDTEASRSNALNLAKDGLVYDLDASCAVKRGQNSNQTDVFPPPLHATSRNPNPPLLTTLVLENITYTHRAAILHFGTLFFMVSGYCNDMNCSDALPFKFQYLTHSHVQFYPRARWEKLRRVDKKVSSSFLGFLDNHSFFFVHLGPQIQHRHRIYICVPCSCFPVAGPSLPGKISYPLLRNWASILAAHLGDLALRLPNSA